MSGPSEKSCFLLVFPDGRIGKQLRAGTPTLRNQYEASFILEIAPGGKIFVRKNKKGPRPEGPVSPLEALVLLHEHAPRSTPLSVLELDPEPETVH